ncbi:MAG: glycosyltransferase family 2 protein [Verrucomicrobiota bacterium]
MNKLPISVCMIAGAEGHRIARALASVAEWTEEIIVVLNEEVTDNTESVAREFGAKVFREPWKGHVAQKNSAAAKASKPWILGLDCDEVVSEPLRAEIQRAINDSRLDEAVAGFSFPRCSQCFGRWIRHGDWYPDRSFRLWKKGRAQWGGIDPHDKLIPDGAVLKLRSDLLHYTVEGIDQHILKNLRYSQDFCRHVMTAGKDVGWLDLVVRPPWRFFRGYVLRLGFLDGWPGFYIAWMTAIQTFLRYAKVMETCGAQQAKEMEELARNKAQGA